MNRAFQIVLITIGLASCGIETQDAIEGELITYQKEYWINFHRHQKFGKVHSELYNMDSIKVHNQLSFDHKEFKESLKSEDSIKIVDETEYKIVEEFASNMGGKNYNLFFHTSTGEGLVYNDKFGPLMRYAAEGFEYIILRQDCFNDSCVDIDLSAYLQDLSQFEQIPGFWK